MKRILMLSILVLMANVAFTQAEKTFVKSFNLNGNGQVVLNLDGQVKVEKWDQPILRVHTVVQVNVSESALSFFSERGRYSIRPKAENGVLFLNSINRDESVKYRGQNLKETISYKVFIPEGVDFDEDENGAQTFFINPSSNIK